MKFLYFNYLLHSLYKKNIMSLPVNNKKGADKKNNNQKPMGGASKFIKGGASGASKPAGAAKKVRSTGANRGS
jgi:hypothetical protein